MKIRIAWESFVKIFGIKFRLTLGNNIRKMPFVNFCKLSIVGSVWLKSVIDILFLLFMFVLEWSTHTSLGVDAREQIGSNGDVQL